MILKITKGCFKQLYAGKIKNRVQNGQFPRKSDLTKLSQRELETLKRLVFMKELNN